MKRLAIGSVVLAGALILAGCSSDDSADAGASGSSAAESSSAATEPTKSAAPSGDAGAGSDSEDAATVVNGSYVTYDEFQSDEAAFAEGDVVLFFHASWCPKCQETEENLNASGVPDGLTVVKVDFDSSTQLRQQYGVTLQHTFVQIDAEGNQVAKWNGSYTADDIVSETV
jgi:thiol-disulfide isomerase/thioredoxin